MICHYCKNHEWLGFHVFSINSIALAAIIPAGGMYFTTIEVYHPHADITYVVIFPVVGVYAADVWLTAVIACTSDAEFLIKLIAVTEINDFSINKKNIIKMEI